MTAKEAAQWNGRDVGRMAAGAAPVLAGILGGPVGAVVGAAGALAASCLGVRAEPGAVARALETDPEAALKLKELELAELSRLLDWRQRQMEAERAFDAELTSRHAADMASDSTLSKNVRPPVSVGAHGGCHRGGAAPRGGRGQAREPDQPGLGRLRLLFPGPQRL